MSSHASLPIDRLLAHREWVRRVARAIVRDDNDADDLEQGLWLQALQRPPRSGRSVRGWLYTALRRDRTDLRRSEERRARRQEATARAESVPSAEDLIARADAHKRVVVAVMDLAEPYRSTILHRFFEDLPPSEIAARMGVPVETVRTRLKRGLAQLRERLDAGNDRERVAWCAVLLLRAPSGAAAVPTTAGALLMGLKTKLAAAAVLLCMVAGVAALWPASPPSHDASAVVASGASTPPAPTRTRVREPAPPQANEPPAAEAAATVAAPRVTLRGTVADEATRSPIAEVRVSVVAEKTGASDPTVFAITDASGRFALDVPPGRLLVRAECGGRYQPYFPCDESQFEIWRRGAQCFDRNTVVVAAGGAPTIDVLLARTGGVEGQVLLADGSPVSDAAIVVRTVTEGARPTEGRADVDGRYRILGVPAGAKLWVEASKTGLVTAAPAAAAVVAGTVTTGVVVRMRKPPVVTGRLTSACGKSLTDACVQVVVVPDDRAMQWGPNGEWLAWNAAARTPVRVGGAYEVPVWPVRGEFLVRATCPGHQPARSAPVRYSEGQDVYCVDLTLAEGAPLAGRVTSKDTGAGIAGAVVRAGPATNPIAVVAAPLRAVCDADGRFTFESVPQDTYLVSASADGHVDGRMAPVTTPAESLVVALAPALAIRGTVRLGGRPLADALVGVQPQEDDALELFDFYVKPFSDTPGTDADGSFTVRGLAAGTYRLHVRPSGGAVFRAKFSAPVAAGSDGVVVEVEPLAPGEAAEPYAWMSNHDLGCSAAGRNLQKDYDGALAMWKSLLARPLTRNERAAASIEYANTLGNLGRRDEQDAALREAIDLAGSGTARGLLALSRLAWSKYWAGDARAALELIGPVTSSADVVQAAGARWSSARFAAKDGDVAAARATLTTLRAEVSASKDARLRRLLPQIDKSLAELPPR
jgi:RNA polymerase sigma-70 factor (ECF subfamily)